MKELSTDEWICVIKKLEKMGVERLIFTGGEALIREDLEKIVAATECELALLSNGTLINEKKYDLLRKFKSIIVSLDSLDLHENSITRVNSEKYPVLRAIQLLPTDIKSKLSIRSVVNRNNKQSITETREYIKNVLGVNYIESACLPNSNKELCEFVPLSSDTNDGVLDNYADMCGAARGVIAINANGDVYPCQSLIKRKYKIGNILDDSWNMENEKRNIPSHFFYTINDIDGCKDCKVKYFCNNGCKAIVNNIYDEDGVRNEFMCQYLYNRSIMGIKLILANKNNDRAK